MTAVHIYPFKPGDKVRHVSEDWGQPMTVRSFGEQHSRSQEPHSEVFVFFEEGGFCRASQLLLLCYIQDTRGCVGNSAIWWKPDGHGYTVDLNQAWKVPATWKAPRDTDKLRPCAEVDALSERHFDVQKLDRLVAAC